MRWFSWTPWPVRRDTKSKRALSKPSPAGSKWCCSGNTVRTSLAPTKVVDNNVAYWRVPAIGAKGHAGVWHEGPPFSKAVNSVDQATLTMADTNGNAVPTTNTPIVKLNPVPGGVALPVQLAPYSAGGCDWSKTNQDRRLSQAETVGIAWTPLVRQPPTVAASDRLRGRMPSMLQRCRLAGTTCR